MDSENLNEVDNLNLDNSVDKKEILGNAEKEDEEFKEKNDQYDDIFNLDENKKTFKKKIFELTDFYLLNDELHFKNLMKKKK